MSFVIARINGTTNINALRTRIEANAFTGDLNIEGNADAIDIAKLKGQLNIRNENGEINVEDITGNTDIENKRDVNVKNFAGTLKVETEFGKISLAQNAALRGDISAESERGHIRLNLPNDIAFRLDANTESGHITAKGFASIATERRQTSLTANYNATANSPMIVLRTVRGNIDLQATGQALKLEQLPRLGLKLGLHLSEMSSFMGFLIKILASILSIVTADGLCRKRSTRSAHRIFDFRPP